MRASLGCPRIAVLGLLALALSPCLLALPNRVYVTPRGKDTATCGAIGAPCKTLAAAVDRVNASGTVVIVESGEFGAVTITKALTIEAAPGVEALIQPGGPAAITINAGASDTVTLRRLVVNQVFYGGPGIVITSAGSVTIEHCTVSGCTNDGVFTSSAGHLSVTDSTFRVNNVGIRTGLASGLASLTVDHCVFTGNGNGILISDYATASVRACVLTGNFHGLGAETFGAGTAEVMVTDCLVTNNSATAVFSSADAAGGSATLRISDSTVTGNHLGLSQTTFGGTSVLLSRGNNTVEGNEFDTSGTIGTYSAK